MLEKKPLISSSLIAGREFPDGSLGNAYKEYMSSHGFDTDERSKVRFISDPDTAYVILRYRQVHDFWHVLCALPPSVLGEIALKWFEWRETGFPSCGLSALIGPLKLSAGEKYLLVTKYVPWAMRSASRSIDLMSYMYEDNLDVPLQVVRQQLNVEPAPVVKADIGRKDTEARSSTEHSR